MEEEASERRRLLTISLPPEQSPSPQADMENSYQENRPKTPDVIPTDPVKMMPENLLSAKFESLDYDTIENAMNERELKKAADSWHHTKVNFLRWVVSLLIGVFTGSIAAAIDYGVETGSNWKYVTIKYYVDKCVSEDCMYIPLLVWIAYNAAFVLVATFLVAVVEPCAAGSGIPQIKCYLNGVKVPRVVRIKTLVCKVIGVTCAVVGGLAVGKEGPMIHSGAVVAAGVSQGRSTTFGFDLGIFESFRSDQEKRDFVSGGAAAGVAAAFGAPVGGMLFSLEEGASFWNQGLTWRIFFSAIISTFSLNVWRSYMSGHPWQLSNPGLINFGRFDNMSYQIYELGIFAIMGVIGGVLGALFNVINKRLTQHRQRYHYSKFVQMAEAIMVAIVTATFGFLCIWIWNDCKRIATTADPEELEVQFFCPDGSTSASTNLFFDTPESSVKRLLHEVAGTFEASTLAVYTSLYFFFALWTYGLSVPSGLFIPSLLIGAGWGRLIGIGIASLNWYTVDPGKYALIGAAAQLGGIVRMTVSLTVIIMEATGNISVGLCIMITLICAKWSGDWVGGKLGCGHGIYDMHIHLASVPLLEWEPSALLATKHAREVMSHPVTVFRVQEEVGRIVDILKKEIHNGFPVVDGYDPDIPQEPVAGVRMFGRFRGTILRHQLIVLLKRKVWSANPDFDRLQRDLVAADFRDNYPRYPPIHHIAISPMERSYIVNLEPFMNTSPYTVHEAASFPRIFKLFRGLGLRHLVVINTDSQVMGMVTRKDLARFRESHEDGNVVIKELLTSK